MQSSLDYQKKHVEGIHTFLAETGAHPYSPEDEERAGPDKATEVRRTYSALADLVPYEANLTVGELESFHDILIRSVDSTNESSRCRTDLDLATMLNNRVITQGLQKGYKLSFNQADTEKPTQSAKALFEKITDGQAGLRVDHDVKKLAALFDEKTLESISLNDTQTAEITGILKSEATHLSPRGIQGGMTPELFTLTNYLHSLIQLDLQSQRGEKVDRRRRFVQQSVRRVLFA